MENKESAEKQLLEHLSYRKKTAFELKKKSEFETIQNFCEEYKQFLNASKTEREAVESTVSILEKEGFQPYQMGDPILPQGNYYLNNREKGLIIFHMGEEDLNQGIRIAAAHCDSPRLDLKPHPLYEKDGLGYLKTHYYGGIRKYQWSTIPLALHGIVTLSDGKKVTVRIGEDEGDPVFVISDLLPHLSKEQDSKPLNEAFPGESLNIIFGSSPYQEENHEYDCDQKIRLQVLSILNKKYGMIESDFQSAELCAVPAGKAVDIGLDRWLIGGYGHDDRVCLYTSLKAFIEAKNSKHTLVCVLADKEETGSEGATGMQCAIFQDLIDEMAEQFHKNPRVIRAHSTCISADVSGAFDPGYANVFEKMNSAFLGAGVAVSKYTGARGKSSTNDASSELCQRIVRIFDEAGVVWQTAELGKVDQGGGGTVAKYISKLNIDTIDIGVPVLSMHAPFEQVSKMDVFSAYEGFLAFYQY